MSFFPVKYFLKKFFPASWFPSTTETGGEQYADASALLTGSGRMTATLEGIADISAQMTGRGSLTGNADTIGEVIVPETGKGGGYGSLFREQYRKPIFADMAARLSGSSTMIAGLSGVADLAAVLQGRSSMEGRPIADITKLLQRRRDEEAIAWLLVA